MGPAAHVLPPDHPPARASSGSSSGAYPLGRTFARFLWVVFRTRRMRRRRRMQDEKDKEEEEEEEAEGEKDEEEEGEEEEYCLCTGPPLSLLSAW